jgi:hypothetical protein
VLTPDWLLEDEDTKRFFRQCQTECEPECCGLDAFGVPLDGLSEPFRSNVVAELEALDLCRVRRRVRALVVSLASEKTAVMSKRFNDTWPTGAAAADWFGEYIVVLDGLLGESPPPRNIELER